MNTAVVGREPGPTVEPGLHGIFIEHLGKCIQDGVYSRTVPNDDGLRSDVLAALKAIAPPVLRRPGGCFADAYRWTDGIGPREDRPRTVTNRWGIDEIEDHQFGTHEFIRLCRELGAEPWITGNAGSGTPRELAEWAEYCNFGRGTTMSDRRRDNGATEPFGVRYWGIGNECWDCGGKFTPCQYVSTYKRFESHFPRFAGQDPYLIAGGPDGNNLQERAAWTDGLMKGLTGDWRRPRLHAVDAHWYTWNSQSEEGSVFDFTEEQWWRLLAKGLGVEEMLREQREVMDRYDPERRVDLLLGEWGIWHASEPGRPLFFRHSGMREAIHTAQTLDLLHRMADIVKIATLTQGANILQAPILTDGDRMVKTPVWDVMVMYRAHRGGRLLPLELPHEAVEGVPVLSGSATRHPDRVVVSLVNGDPRSARTVALDLPAEASRVRRWELCAPFETVNTFDAPDAARHSVTEEPFASPLTLPPASVTVLELMP